MGEIAFARPAKPLYKFAAYFEQQREVRMAKVTVHSVEAWEINRGDWATLPFKTIEKGIEELPHTAGLPRIVPGTAEEVDASELDTHGRYYPKRSHTE